MKRIFLVLCFLIPLATFAGTPRNTVPKAGISALISECKHYEGAEVVSLGRIAMSLMKGVIRNAAKDDPDARKFASMIKGVHKCYVFDFGDCSAEDQARIVKKLDRTLSRHEMLMEAGDSGEKMIIYGMMDGKTDGVKDIVMYAPSDCSLICLFGTLSAEAISKLTSND